jgi:hypothetical protein
MASEWVALRQIRMVEISTDHPLHADPFHNADRWNIRWHRK